MSVFDPDDDGTPPGPEALGLPASERDYLVPAKNSQGQSVRVMCRLAPETSRMIAEVFQAHKWPFRVQGDLIRYAITSVTKRLAVGAGLTGSVIAHGEMIHDMLLEEEYQLQWEENFRMLRRVVDMYIARGAPGKARELVNRMRASIVPMKEGYWKDQYEAEILKRYGNILDGDTTPQPTASTPFIPHDE